MKVIIALCASLFNKLLRNVYWLYNALEVTIGKNVKIGFPFIVEGKGKIKIGNRVRIGRSVTFACGENGSITVGNESSILDNVKLFISKNEMLQIGDNTLIENDTTCYVHKRWIIGSNVVIATHCQIFSREKGFSGSLTIGDGSRIGNFSLLDVSDNIVIGKEVAIGPGCTIYTHDHNYHEEGILSPWKGRPITKAVVIEDGAWIGSNVTILPGVIVGKKAIIAAGAVVAKNIPERTIFGGIPAKMIKQISDTNK